MELDKIRTLSDEELKLEEAKAAEQPKELQGRDGPEPTRYGDWEKDGLTSDF